MTYRADSDIFLPFTYLRDVVEDVHMSELSRRGRKWREFSMETFLKQVQIPGTYYHSLYKIAIHKTGQVG